MKKVLTPYPGGNFRPGYQGPDIAKEHSYPRRVSVPKFQTSESVINIQNWKNTSKNYSVLIMLYSTYRIMYSEKKKMSWNLKTFKFVPSMSSLQCRNEKKIIVIK